MATLADFLALTETYGRNAAPPPAPEMDLRSMLMFAGPAIMAAAGKPGASFGGSVGEGMMTGMQFAERRREREEARQRQAHTDALARLEIGSRLYQASQKEAKPPTIGEFYDETTGRPFKAQYDPTTREWTKVGGVKSDPAKDVRGILADLPDGRGGTIKALVNPVTGERIATLGGGDPGKAPTGFQWLDPADPTKGVRPIPGYQEGMAQGEAMKPFTLPEGGARYPGAAPGQAGQTGQSPPLSVRLNNPGNIVRSDTQWAGLAPQQQHDRFATFATPEDGIRAARDNILAYRDKHGLNTVEGIVSRWAPPNENNTPAYIASVAKALGVDPKAPLNLDDPQVQAGLVAAIARQEGGGATYTPEVVQRALGRGQGVAGAPGQAQAGTLRPIAERAPSSRFERAYDQEEGKALAKERNEIAEAAKSGRETIAQANALQTLLEQTGTGKTVPLTTGMKAWAKSVGVDLEALGFRDNVATAEAASRIAREISLKFIQQTKGAISNAEMQIFLEMVPTLSNTPEGNRILLDAMRAVAKRQVDIDRAARAYETRPDGRFDRGFADQLEAIFARNPILPPDIQQRAQAPAPAAPAPERAATAPRGAASRTEPAGQGAATAGQGGDLPRTPDGKIDRTKLVEGQVYTTPQGKRYRFNGVSFEEAR